MHKLNKPSKNYKEDSKMKTKNIKDYKQMSKKHNNSAMQPADKQTPRKKIPAAPLCDILF